MKPSSLIASRVVLRAACALGVAVATAVVSLDCGGKIGGTSPDGGPASGSSGGSSGGGSGSSSGVISSSGSSGSSSSGSSTVCTPLPGCQSTTYCPTACGGCSCSGGQWVCNQDPNCVADASPPPLCPGSPPATGEVCTSPNAMCPYPAMPGCVANCYCTSVWTCDVTCSTPTCVLDGGLYRIDVPDSGIGNTGATLAGCYSCLENTCSPQFNACSGDCVCQQGVEEFLKCMASGTPTLSCGMTLQSTGGPNGSALVQCAAAPLLGGPGPGCLTQCGVTGVGIADAAVTD